MTSTSPPSTVFITGISSDIGQELARQYLAEGYDVIGTYRTARSLHELAQLGVTLIQCDLGSRESQKASAAEVEKSGLRWDLYISAVGDLAPIGLFLDCDADEWTNSVSLNGAEQIAFFHRMARFRRARPLARAAFLVGGAINRSFPHYSAYSLGKLQLVKFCELIHDEIADLHIVSIGTGWVATKIHNQTLQAGAAAGENFRRTVEFLEQRQMGTPIADIKSCIDWTFAQPRGVTGGRNFSVVHDTWRSAGAPLAKWLADDQEAFKLRRHGNGSDQRRTVE